MILLAKKLTELYEQETWHKKRLSKEEADRYHLSRLNSGNIITVEDNGLLCGYVEFYQNHGCCYIHNLFIRPEYRRGKVAKLIKQKLFEVCDNAKVYLGNRNKNGKRYSQFQLRRQNGRY